MRMYRLMLGTLAQTNQPVTPAPAPTAATRNFFI
jgi:hypothetical protein